MCDIADKILLADKVSDYFARDYKPSGGRNE